MVNYSSGSDPLKPTGLQEEKTCMILDVANLNAVFKYGERFAMALNYSSGVSRIAMDARALPRGSSIYLSMMPRQAGEGNYTINYLSAGGVQFEVDATEIVDLYEKFASLPNISNVYITNALANIAAHSSISNFKMAIWYGSRIAVCEVENSLLSSLEVYPSMEAFSLRYPETHMLYGEYDIVDKNIMQAQYPELSSIDSKQFQIIVPLLSAYNTAYKIDIEEIIAECKSIIGGTQEQIEDEPEGEEVEVPASVEEVERAADREEPAKDKSTPELTEMFGTAARDNHQSTKVQNRRQKKVMPHGAMGKIVVANLCAIVIGAGVSAIMARPMLTEARAMGEQQLQLSEAVGQMEHIFRTSNGRCSKFIEQLEYAKGSKLAVTIGDATSYTDKCVLTASMTGDDVKSQFEDYLGKKYTVVSSDILNMEQSGNKTAYTIMFTIA